MYLDSARPHGEGKVAFARKALVDIGHASKQRLMFKQRRQRLWRRVKKIKPADR